MSATLSEGYLIPDDKTTIINTKKFGVPLIDRELSWLSFNDRVRTVLMREGVAPSRFHFLAIAESNLNEFISVRYSDIVEAYDADDDNKDLKRYLSFVRKIIMAQKFSISEMVQLLLGSETNVVMNGDPCPSTESIFLSKVKSAICPVIVGPNKDIPKFRTDELNLFVKLVDSSQKKLHCFIQIPKSLDRLYKVNTLQDGTVKVPIERMIVSNLDHVFEDVYSVEGCVLFKVIKQCNETLDRDSSVSLVTRINKIITNREDNRIIWIDCAKVLGGQESSNKMMTTLRKLLKVQKEHLCTYPDSLLVDIGYTMKELPKFKGESYKFSPSPIIELADEDSIMDYLDDNIDLVVHHPYQSFDVVIDFLKEAAKDPKVICIRQTLYRVSSIKSPIVKALCDAARNGKHVNVMLELLARFDEKQNIKLINTLKEAGCNVSYSLETFKTHCKVCIVTRQGKNKLKNYAHVGTGNYNEKTAKIYTDISYFTSDVETCESLINVFSFATGFQWNSVMPKVCYSPSTMLPSLMDELDRIGKFLSSNDGNLVTLKIKVNSFNNVELIKAIYDLANTYPNRFEVRLICRGICSMVHCRENIKIKSIVGKFLEHSRIVITDLIPDDPDDDVQSSVLIGSSDLLDRNLYKRIEVLVKVETATSQAKVQDIFDALWKDTANSWIMDENGVYSRVNDTKDWHYDAHRELMNLE